MAVSPCSLLNIAGALHIYRHSTSDNAHLHVSRFQDGPSWAHLGPSWCHLGATLGHPGAISRSGGALGSLSKAVLKAKHFVQQIWFSRGRLAPLCFHMFQLEMQSMRVRPAIRKSSRMTRKQHASFHCTHSQLALLVCHRDVLVCLGADCMCNVCSRDWSCMAMALSSHRNAYGKSVIVGTQV